MLLPSKNLASANHGNVTAAKKEARILKLRLLKKSVKSKKRSEQWGMSNLFRKNSRTSAFFDKHWLENKRQNLMEHDAQLLGVTFIIALFLAFLSFLYREDSKVYPLPFEYSDNRKFYPQYLVRRKCRITGL